jgi:Xaa-Pro aminopeptidase
MKRDLDQLMGERGIDAAIVTGSGSNNPPMYYMLNGAHISGGILVKRREQAPVLINYDMERDEAAKSGLATLNMTHFDYTKLRRESQSGLEAAVKLYRKIFDEFSVAGKVAFYGVGEKSSSFALLKALDEELQGVSIAGEYENDIFTAARSTKETDEIERMRRVGQSTAAVMREMLNFIRDQRVVGDTLVRSDGAALTVGDVKRFGRSRLLVHELEDPEGMIFAIGRDAGVPHSRGEADAPLRLGQSIVFDFFPREAGGGYFHDMTRTFCLGYAPPEVQKVYDDVRECLERVRQALEPDAPTRRYEELVCDVFEAQGHNTPRQDSARQEGYVHSLGHGVGLNLHEQPFFGLSKSNQNVLRPGAVFTLEPGLYYPEQGLGVRLENTVYLDENGQFHSLTDFPMELVIEM